ncbi:MAG: leucine--tRNA ligase, partial [Erysipelotrichaceae bacterium]|nr:leucine--tRNA ligase [Erysipelotrichaceae bacterium]
ELWSLLCKTETSIAYEPWPSYDEKKLVEEEITIIVQVNGKLRGKFQADATIEEEQMKEEAMKLAPVQTQIENKAIQKVIVVKKKLVNIVVK